MSRHICLAAAMVALSTATVGCSKHARAYLPSSSPTVAVAMREFGFDFDHNIPSGRVVLRFENKGTVDHKVQVLPLDDDFPPIDEQIRGGDRRFIAPYAQIFPKAPGEHGAVALNLIPGHRYAFICMIYADDGESHAFKGMTSEFRTKAN